MRVIISQPQKGNSSSQLKTVSITTNNNIGLVKFGTGSGGGGSVGVDSTARILAGEAFDQANAAYLQANLAYNQANSGGGLANGGTITGNLTVTGNVTIQGNTSQEFHELFIGPVVKMFWAQTTISDGLPVVVEQYGVSEMTTARFTIQVMAPAHGYHSLEFFVVQDGTNLFTQEYSEIWTITNLGSFNASIVGSNVQILFTPVFQNNIIKVARYGLTP